VIPLAVETDSQNWLSSDYQDAGQRAKLSMPLRLVSSGNSSTTINRVLFLPVTGTSEDDKTDADIEVEITAGAAIILQQGVFEPHQSNFQKGGNRYFLDAPVPFTKGDVLSNWNQVEDRWDAWR
jgi:hypothetical protein